MSVVGLLLLEVIHNFSPLFSDFFLFVFSVLQFLMLYLCVESFYVSCLDSLGFLEKQSMDWALNQL